MKTGLFTAITTILLLALGSAAARNAQADIPANERAALIALYNSTNGYGWYDKAGWKTPPLHADGFAMPGTEGDWYGVFLNGGGTAVESIELQENNLRGSLPAQLGDLANLKELWLHDNRLTGSLPEQLGNLSNLIFLYLDGNQLTGSLPAALGS